MTKAIREVKLKSTMMYHSLLIYLPLMYCCSGSENTAAALDIIEYLQSIAIYIPVKTTNIYLWISIYRDIVHKNKN